MQFKVDKHFFIASLLIALSLLVFKFSGFTLQDAVNLPLLMMVGLSGKTFTVAMSVFAVALFSLGLVLFAASEDSSQNFSRVLLWLTVTVAGVLIYGLSIIFLAFSLSFLGAIFISSTYYPLLFSEFKKWKYYRASSKVISMSLLVVGMGLAAGAFVELSLDDSYTQNFKGGLVEFLLNSQETSLPNGADSLTQEQREVLQRESQSKNREVVSKALDESPLVSLFLQGLPLFTALTILFSLEFAKIFITFGVGILSALIVAKSGLMDHREIPKKKEYSKKGIVE